MWKTDKLSTAAFYENKDEPVFNRESSNFESIQLPDVNFEIELKVWNKINEGEVYRHSTNDKKFAGSVNEIGDKKKIN